MDAQTFQKEAMKLERLLYHICYGMLHNQSDCEDAIQEALLRAWKNRHQLRDMEHFRSWLCRITANACQDVLRKRQHEGVYDDAMTDNQPASIDLEQMVLRDALSTLSPEVRVCMTLYYLDGIPIREVAETLEIPEGTVKTRLMKGREKMSKLLREVEA